ncbi:MAG: geranylgeranyl pyrophosphate synthase, partial [Thermoleophilia bacterium]|nr:geranylgeranyl pyrophosphate synthase [Thermoleophilia bacterium]
MTTRADDAPIADAASLGDLRALVNIELARAFSAEDASVAPLGRAIDYSLLAPGKRIRPVLALAAAEACGMAPAAVAKVAAAFELVHAYSLVHDDLPAMDDDDLRRGVPTSHKVYGEAVAVLVGDALQARAFELVATDEDVTPAARVRSEE